MDDLNLNRYHGSNLISVVHNKYASDCTVTMSLSRILQVLIKDPKAIGVSPAYVGQITTIYLLDHPQMFLEDDESDGVLSYFTSLVQICK